MNITLTSFCDPFPLRIQILDEKQIFLKLGLIYGWSYTEYSNTREAGACILSRTNDAGSPCVRLHRH